MIGKDGAAVLLLVAYSLAVLVGIGYLIGLALGLLEAGGQAVAITGLVTIVGLFTAAAGWCWVLMAAMRFERETFGLH